MKKVCGYNVEIRHLIISRLSLSCLVRCIYHGVVARLVFDFGWKSGHVCCLSNSNFSSSDPRTVN